MQILNKDSERLLYITTQGYISKEDSENVLFLDEIFDYTFIPYEGKLKKLEELYKDRYLYTWKDLYILNRKKEKWNVIHCKVSNDRKEIYIQKNNFEIYWRAIYSFIKYIRINKLDNYDVQDINNQVDLSKLKTPIMDVKIDENFKLQYIKLPPTLEIQRMYSKKASAMDDNKIGYVYSKNSEFIHDKTCVDVEKIAIWNFCATSELPEDKKMCPKCKKRMMVRSAIGDDAKHFNWYMRMFKKCGVGANKIGEFVQKYGATLRMEAVDIMRVKCNEDTWQIHINANGECTLYHNNYKMINDTERIMTSGFHLQNYKKKKMQGILSYIEDYTWEKHLEGKERKEGIVYSSVNDTVIVEQDNNDNRNNKEKYKKISIWKRIVWAAKKMFMRI